MIRPDLRPAFDPTVAVLMDSRRSEHLLAKGTVLAALRHWGIPHTVADLANAASINKAIGKAGVILVAQEYLGGVLAPHLDAIIRMVRQGAGLINLDNALAEYPSDYRSVLGIQGEVEEDSAEDAALPHKAHAIGCGRAPGSVVRFKQPLPVTHARECAGDALLVGQAEEPLVSAQHLGDGRIVQWLLSPKVWNERYLGLAHGLDGLLWRSCVWAGPKPFCMNSMPPLVRFRFDDCHGLWREPADLSFVDEFVKRDHIPSICFCLRALTPDGISTVAQLQREGSIGLAPHTLEADTSLFSGDSAGEYSRAQFTRLFGELDDARRRWGVEWSRLLSDHDHEWSENAVPFLRERGMTFKMNITLPGERWAGEHTDWRPGPFGSMNYALDHLPPPLEDFFVVMNHHPSFETARVYLDESVFLYHRPGGFGRQKWDFLNGLVRPGGAGEPRLSEIVERLVEHCRIGLDSLFFGGSISHSHFTQYLDRREWGEILDRADRGMSDVEWHSASYDEIAEYAKARQGVQLTGTHRKGGRLEARLIGSTDRPLRLSVFDEEDGRLLRREEEVPPFEGELRVAMGGG